MFRIYYLHLFILIIIISKGANCVQISEKTKNNTLKLVHIVFRHGHRTVKETFPNDPYKNHSYYPYGKGHLTNKGKNYLYETGKFLRQRYGTFLGNNYIPETVYAETTSMYRTYMSLSMILAGLYPTADTDMNWNDELNWQPIPIITKKLNEKNILLQMFSCPRIAEEAIKLGIHYIKTIRLNVNGTSIEQLAKYLGNQIKSTSDILTTYNALKSMEEYGLPLPNWAINYYPNILESLSNEALKLLTVTEELQRIQAGPFLHKVISDCQRKIESTPSFKQKIYLYSGHDITVVNILNSLKIWQEKFPVFGIMAIFELVQNWTNGKYGIQIYVRSDPKIGLIPLVLPGCHQHFCPFHKFVKLTKHLTTFNFIDDCKLKDSTFKNVFHINCSNIYCR